MLKKYSTSLAISFLHMLSTPAKSSNNKIAQAISCLIIKTPTKKASKAPSNESAYFSGKVIIEDLDMPMDSSIENSIPQLQPSSKQGPGLPSTTTPNERTTYDVVISMMEKLDKRLNDMEEKIFQSFS